MTCKQAWGKVPPKRTKAGSIKAGITPALGSNGCPSASRQSLKARAKEIEHLMTHIDELVDTLISQRNILSEERNKILRKLYP